MTNNTRHTLILVLVLALVISIAPAGIAQESEGTNDNSALVEYYIHVWNFPTAEAFWPEPAFYEILSDDHITHTSTFGSVEGADAVLEVIENVHVAMPDYAFTVDDISVTDDTVWVSGTITGTHSGPLMLDENLPIIPSDNAVNVRAMLVATVTDGEISRVEWHDDTFSMMTQMGAAKAPGDVVKEQVNTATVQSLVDTLYAGDASAGTRDALVGLYSDNITRHTPNNRQTQEFAGADYAIEQFDALNASFPEREFTVISLTATGDYATLVYEISGDFVADMGTPNGGTVIATNDEYGWDGAFVFRLEDGHIAEEWWYWDNELFAKVDYGYAD